MRSPWVSVTGATGFLGWHVCEAFRDAGWQVRAVVRPGSSRPLPPGVSLVHAPLESGALAHALAGSDVVVHAAGLNRAASAATLEAVNEAGTRAVVQAANARGPRLILISSQAAVGTGTLARPSLEDDGPHPLTMYGRSKLASEGVIRSLARVSWTILRPASVFGARDRQFLPLFKLASRGLFPLVANPEAAFTLIHVEDVARAVVLAAASTGARSGDTLFLGHPEAQRAGDLLKALATVFDRPYRPRRLPLLALRGLALLGDLSWKIGREPWFDTARFAELRSEGFVCAVDRARDVLGFSAAIPLRVGLDRTLRWYREEGWLRSTRQRR